jgi:prepilin-type processing-associated H-X9-DG protein
MRCASCQAALDEASPTCPSCGNDARLWVRSPDGAAYGPYVLADVRQYAAEGRIAPNAVLVTAAGQAFTLAQAGVVSTAPYTAAVPAYAGAPPPAARSGGLTCVVIALIVAAAAVPVVAIIAAILFPVFVRAREKARQASCLANVNQIGLGMAMYAADYDDHFPLESSWRDGVQAYLKNLSIMECPSSGLGQQSYDMAPDMSGVETKTVPNPQDRLLIYEHGLGQGTGGPHQGGGNVGFVDGHARWLRQSDFSVLPNAPSPSAAGGGTSP